MPPGPTPCPVGAGRSSAEWFPRGGGRATGVGVRRGVRYGVGYQVWREIWREIWREVTVEDILITLGRQYHLIRPLTSSKGSLFLYLALDRTRSNLALARHALKRVESGLEV